MRRSDGNRSGRGRPTAEDGEQYHARGPLGEETTYLWTTVCFEVTGVANRGVRSR